jgi:hypothetical protein
MTQLASSARRASNSHTMAGLARFGLVARAFVYLVIGWLAVQIARGHGGHEANQRGAVGDIAQHPYGVALLWVLGIGFAAYAIWRLSEATSGTAAGGNKAGPRLQSLVRGVVYVALSVSTFSFIAGASQQGQSQQQETLTARVMKHSYGRWVVGLIGLVVVVIGLGMIVEGVRKKFEKQLRMQELTGAARTFVVRLGMVGTVARGIVFAIAGTLVVQAAVTFNARKSTGLDGALRTLADRAYGPWLLGVLALGLVAFGLFGFAVARWVKT